MHLHYVTITHACTVYSSGTGKSETGAHIAYIFAQVLEDCNSKQCVVYCAPSNKAVDVVHG